VASWYGFPAFAAACPAADSIDSPERLAADLPSSSVTCRSVDLAAACNRWKAAKADPATRSNQRCWHWRSDQRHVQEFSCNPIAPLHRCAATAAEPVLCSPAWFENFESQAWIQEIADCAENQTEFGKIRWDSVWEVRWPGRREVWLRQMSRAQAVPSCFPAAQSSRLERSRHSPTAAGRCGQPGCRMAAVQP